MRPNIALIGFMGTGKSAVGLELSRRLGLDLVEVDDLIAERAGKSIPEIFADEGEAAFRALEREAIAEVALRRGAVISCGGGAVLEPENVDRLRRSSVIVLLTAPVEEILSRAARDGEARPLLNTKEREARARELLKRRQPLYLRAADYVVETSGLEPGEVAEAIVECLRREP
ncbi:hypothetical protein AC482_01025 [miscellaneous Crenarchaeota group-15 archaeon DG-45]|uniref:shikimate kinase n=1 Tax=miscellaneous Crenarchaeota group-15 archaeon DG-45 TaxID=1685127 RepID=A0A0M0BSE6_9ARCH|nr:MAG: hypothetical protein AC482_01025 [miscellaneous Crenarchaeota group-15 archaeon DG-45]